MARLSLPPATRAFCALLICLSTLVTLLRYWAYVLLVADQQQQQQQQYDLAPPGPPAIGAHDIYVPYLTIVSGKVLAYPWVLLTASFVERSLIYFVMTGATLLYGAKYCENIWGSKELTVFVFLQTIIPNILAVVFYSVFGSSGSPTSVCGGVAIMSGILVALKQLIPEHNFVLFKGLIRLRFKYLPALFLLANTMTGIFFDNAVWAVHAWTGFFVSWIYLRFFRISYADPLLPFSSSHSISSPVFSTIAATHANPSGLKIRGDASESFSCANFFPEPLSHLIEVISCIVFNALTTVRLCTPFSQLEIETSNARAFARSHAYSRAHGGPYAGTNNGANSRDYYGVGVRAESERRRALALRALDQRLNSSNTTNSPSSGVDTPSLTSTSSNYLKKSDNDKDPQPSSELPASMALDSVLSKPSKVLLPVARAGKD